MTVICYQISSDFCFTTGTKKLTSPVIYGNYLRELFFSSKIELNKNLYSWQMNNKAFMYKTYS